MPRAAEIATIIVGTKRYRDWETVSVTRSGQDLFSKFTFTAASPIEGAPNFAGLKLRIGDPCQIYLADRQVINGRIRVRQSAYDDKTHGLQISGSSENSVIGRATVDHSKGEFKNSTLSQIANNLLQPYGIRFYLKGETSGADKPFEKVNVQAGETVFSAIERLCRMRNIYMFDDAQGSIVGYRLGKGATAIADLQLGRNIKKGSGVLDYEGAFSKVEAVLQRPGNDEHHGDDARDVSATINNPAVTQFAPHRFMGEMPGDQADARMRAQHENGENKGTIVNANYIVQGWFADDNNLWLEHIGDPVSVYDPFLFTDDRMNLAIQDVTCTQSAGGTETTLGLVLPDRFNGGGQVDATAIPNATGT